MLLGTMKRLRRLLRVIAPVVALAAPAAGCSSDPLPPGDDCDPLLRAANLACEGDPEVEQALQIMGAMSLEEKVQQMSGPPYNPNNTSPPSLPPKTSLLGSSSISFTL